MYREPGEAGHIFSPNDRFAYGYATVPDVLRS
jgi:hypothetical protein